MANISLPNPGQKPWSLNPAITAMNNELNGRLSELNINTLIGEAVSEATPVPAGVLTRRTDGALILVAPVEPTPDPPSAPSNVTVTPGVGQALVSWSAASAPTAGPISDYRVEYKSVSASTWTLFNKPASTNLNTVVTGLANNVAYQVRVAGVNVSGFGPFATSGTFTPGAVNGVVYQDNFNRTSSDIVGTNPTVGMSAYSGAVNQFQTDGARLVGKSGASGGLVTYDTKARGDKSMQGVCRLSTEASSAATTRRFYVSWIDSQNNLYFAIGVSTAGAVSISLSGNFAGTFATLPTGFPASTIPGTTAVANYDVSFSLTGVNWSFTVNGTTRTGTLTSDQLNAIAAATTIGYTAATTPTNVIWDDVSFSVNGTYV